jgi:hypothetical protein
MGLLGLRLALVLAGTLIVRRPVWRAPRDPPAAIPPRPSTRRTSTGTAWSGWSGSGGRRSRRRATGCRARARTWRSGWRAPTASTSAAASCASTTPRATASATSRPRPSTRSATVAPASTPGGGPCPSRSRGSLPGNDVSVDGSLKVMASGDWRGARTGAPTTPWAAASTPRAKGPRWACDTSDSAGDWTCAAPTGSGVTASSRPSPGR